MSENLDGAKAKREMTECGLKQKELTGATGVSPATIGKYEINCRTPDAIKLMMIGAEIEMSVG
jgi:transcriptional regulator with XRE-family HTH domain